ncbi:nagb/rpia/CoA transferase-like protein [Dendrothele bispora CBS 962.96]|uniref:5-formyltetrahydrofolate cyclo-ligase n=1 Tax=Dendrothele bispora (strain CBS 962.96) TaxID=1314807 RepID=A0A4S8LKZ3_DENBC|nr:nagb/rpia/CoA transferase-like protein [Dendrothele bispora CBS 962.96]
MDEDQIKVTVRKESVAHGPPKTFSHASNGINVGCLNMLATMYSTLKTQKKVLRKVISFTLRSLDSAYIQEQSSAVAAKVLSLPSLRQYKNVSCYLNIPTGELDTSSIVKEVLNPGETLFVPTINIVDMWRTREWDEIQRCETDKCWLSYFWTALDPPSESDTILVPDVAFDRSMARLEHGKGYYDRDITSYIATGRPRPLLGLLLLALREQLLDSATSTNGLVPTGEHDWTMDIIVTPDEVLHVNANSTKD